MDIESIIDEDQFLETFYESIHNYELAINDNNTNKIIKYKYDIESLVRTNMINSSNKYGNILLDFITLYENTLHKTEYNLSFALNYFINNPHVNNKIKSDKHFIKYKYFF